MICKECKDQGLKSSVYSGGVMSTLMATQEYWDAEGKRHIHDRNRIAESFSCSNGHKWNIDRKGVCPTCGENWK